MAVFSGDRLSALSLGSPSAPTGLPTTGNRSLLDTAMTPYQKKLLDPRWQKKRLEKLSEANWSCELCADTDKTLHVHHPKYIRGRDPWDYELDQLQVLCNECHGKHHAIEAQLAELFSSDSVHYRTLSGLIAGFITDRTHPTCPDTPLALVATVDDITIGLLAKMIHEAPKETWVKVVRLLHGVDANA